MSLAQLLLKSIRRSVRGNAWHGPSLKDATAGLTPEQAWAHPIPNAHSIAELLLHTIAWMEETASRLDGQFHDEPLVGDFPNPGSPSPQQWEQHLALLESTLQRLLQSANQLTETDLQQQVAAGIDKPAAKISRYTMLAGVSEHNTYHAGQMILLRKLCS